MFRQLINAGEALGGADSGTTVRLLSHIEEHCRPSGSSSSVEESLATLAETCDARGSSSHYRSILDQLFTVGKFTGNKARYGASDNSLLTRVLATRLGIPLTLCVVAQSVLGHLGHQSYLVGLPGHVVLGVPDGGSTIYVDCFNGGREMSREQCVSLVAASGSLDESHSALMPMTPSLVALRTLNNLVAAFRAEMDQVGLARVAALRLCVPFLSAEDVRSTQALLAQTN